MCPLLKISGSAATVDLRRIPCETRGERRREAESVGNRDVTVFKRRTKKKISKNAPRL